jgi:putative nucleotide binding protein|tara:strand:+ start:30890 stop:31429 length:540 start_codon:yes stop_codon:yes gene_type:complete
MQKEEHAIVLEYLPNGYPLEGKMMPIAQAIGKQNLVLLELVPRKGISLETGEEVYIGPDKREKIYYILGRLKREKITEHSKEKLMEVIENITKEREKQFIDFFNKAEAINKRVHQIELLPGMGKKHMQEIIKEREEKEFGSFEDMKKRVSNLPDPEKAVEKRIFQEITQMERYNLFVSQ